MSVATLEPTAIAFRDLTVPLPSATRGSPGTTAPSRELPDPHTWAAKLARCAVESIAGRRSMAQLTRWLSPEVFDKLARRAGLSVRIHGAQSRAAVVRRVVVCEIDPERVEASVVVEDGARVRAIAIRLTAHRGRWLATELQVG